METGVKSNSYMLQLYGQVNIGDSLPPTLYLKSEKPFLTCKVGIL